MKLIEAIKLTGKPVQVPDCPRNELPQFFADLGFKTGAEIGVYKGEYAARFCQVGLTTYAIDPWLAYKGAGPHQESQARQDFLFGHASRLLAQYKNAVVIRKTSMDAVKDFKPESLDFVYIDGDHRFPSIAQDLSEWYLRVKKGGIVSGHDYFTTPPSQIYSICHVKPVLDAFIETFEIPNFFVFGRSKPIELEGRNDKTLSWMFFKP